MVWFRKVIVALLSLILFFAILDGVISASLDMTFSHPYKLETWLNESGIYKSFISTALTDASNSMNDGGQNNGVSLNDPAVQQIAETVFSPAVVRQYVATFLNGNYAWLEGKTATPVFSINVAAAKTEFAQQVGQYVTSHLNTLPLCTPSQSLAATEANDPLQLTCRPIGMSSAQASAQITSQLENSSGFFNKSVITQNTVNPNSSSSSTSAQPYYVQLKEAPKIYQLATKVPWILAGLSILCMVGIYFISPIKRRGIRKLMFIAFEVGIILVVIKIVTNILFKKFENKFFNQSSIGPLQKSLTTFARTVETQLNNINFKFGIGLILIGIIIAVVLIITHKRGKEAASLAQAKTLASTENQASVTSSDKKDVTAKNQSMSAQPVTPSSKPPQPKKPRLVQ